MDTSQGAPLFQALLRKTNKENPRPQDVKALADILAWSKIGTNMHLVETPVQSSQSPNGKLRDTSGPTYQESPFNLCARSAQRNEAKTSRRRLVGRLYIEDQGILRRAARDETLGRMCVGRI